MKRAFLRTFLLVCGLASFACFGDCNLFFGKQIKDALQSSKLKDIPELAKYLKEMLNEPGVPLNLKRIIVNALTNPDLSLHNLTPAVREASGLYYPAAHITDNRKFRTHNDAHSNANLEAMKELKESFFGQNPLKMDEIRPGQAKKEWIMLNDSKIESGSHTNQLADLVHEFSHVRFDSFLLGALPKLAKKMPHFVRLDADGFYSMDASLYTFLSERYALHVEFQTVKSTYGRSHQHWPENFGGESQRESFLSLSPERLRKVFADHVLSSYDITDPRIQALSDVPISQILLGNFR